MDNIKLREIKIKLNPLSGMKSCYFSMGNSICISGIYHILNKVTRPVRERRFGSIISRYYMTSFSTEERIRGNSFSKGRTKEINKVIVDAFSSTIINYEYPEDQFFLLSDIVSADGGTRCCAINGLSIALALSDISFRGLIASVAFGKYKGELLLDLNGDQDKNSDSDCPMAIRYPDEKVVLLQMDGELTINEFFKGLKIGKEGCDKIHKLQIETVSKHLNAK